MKIFKENSYDIVRLYVNQLGIMIFSMLLYTAVGSFENESLSASLSILVSVFSTCFYLVLVYYAMWEIGAKDKIRIDGGKMESCKNKGLVMGLFANVPNLALGFISVILMAAFLLGGGDGVYAGFLIFNTLMRFHASMFLGVITAIVPSGLSAGTIDYVEFLIEAILFTVLPLISAAVTHLAYTLGSREKKFFSFLSGKK
jgi:hypothetical protein